MLLVAAFEQSSDAEAREPSAQLSLADVAEAMRGENVKLLVDDHGDVWDDLCSMSACSSQRKEWSSSDKGRLTWEQCPWYNSAEL